MRANEQTDERVAQYSKRLFYTIIKLTVRQFRPRRRRLPAAISGDSDKRARINRRRSFVAVSAPFPGFESRMKQRQQKTNRRRRERRRVWAEYRLEAGRRLPLPLPAGAATSPPARPRRHCGPEQKETVIKSFTSPQASEGVSERTSERSGPRELREYTMGQNTQNE